MAFWRKKSEDPWDIDPDRKREPTSIYERDPKPWPEPTALKNEEGLAMPAQTAGKAAEQEPREDVPDCPWCGRKMVRAYLLGGREMLCFTDQEPHGFLGSLGYEKTYLDDESSFLGGNYRSCWQCKPCYKLVIDVPRPTVPFGGATVQGALSEDTFTHWDGNPVAPYTSEKQEKEE